MIQVHVILYYARYRLYCGLYEKYYLVLYAAKQPERELKISTLPYLRALHLTPHDPQGALALSINLARELKSKK